MNIIQHGNKYHEATCPSCNCKFGYLDRDIIVMEDHKPSRRFPEMHSTYIVCPECFESLFLTYKEKRRGEDWKDVKPDMLVFI